MTFGCVHHCFFICRALCYLKVERFAEAKQDCDAALKLEPTNKKAFYRRAMANKGLKVNGALMTNDRRKDVHLCLYLKAKLSSVCATTGLPCMQLWPAGGAASGSQRAGGWEGAGGSDSAAQTESGHILTSQTQEDCPHHRGRNTSSLHVALTRVTDTDSQ